MIQPIDRETTLQILTDAGCPNGYLASFALHHPQWDWMQHALNAAVAHSRKDAEPVGYTDASWLTQPSGTFVTKPHPSFKMALFTHPPEADKLLQQALEALDSCGAYPSGITWVDLNKTTNAATAIRTYLENKA